MDARSARALLRTEYPFARRHCFLDVAGGRLLCRRAASTSEAFERACVEEPRTAGPAMPRHEVRVRAQLGRLLRVAPGRVVLCHVPPADTVRGDDEARVACLGALAAFDAADEITDRSADPRVGRLVRGDTWLGAGVGVGFAILPTEWPADVASHLSAWPRLDTRGAVALGGALDVLTDFGAARLVAMVREHTATLARALGTDPGSDDGVLHLPVDAPERVAASLAARQVVVGLTDRGIRLSPHAWHTAEELEAAVATIRAAIDGDVPHLVAEDAPRLVCVDLNGVLDQFTGWRGRAHWDPPAPGARAFLEGLRAAGCRVVLFTTRHYSGVWRWLVEHDLDGFVDDVTDRKPPADVFVDDHAVNHAGDLAETLTRVLAFRPHWQRPTPPAARPDTDPPPG